MSTMEAAGGLLVVERAPAEARPGRLRRMGRGIGSAAEWGFGVASLVLGLSFLAALPLTQFLCLGYFLESSARVARTGRWRDGLIGVRKSARAGGVALGMGLSLLPVWLARTYAGAAALVDPGGGAELGWRVALGVVSALVFGHLVAACGRGARLRHFLWPGGSLLWWIRLPGRPGTYRMMRDGFWEFLRGFRFPRYFRLGAVGFAGTLAWLAPPAFLISRSGPAPLLGVLGVVWLGLVVPFLPFLQVRYAAEGNWRALFQVRGVKERFKRAPWAFAVALMALLLAAIPLYLLKIETIPREASWLPALIFVVFLMPARILTGWAYARAIRREKPRHWAFRLLGRAAIVPAAALYVLVVFLAQYTSWGGSWSLFEQHAFLLPVPFLHR